MPGRDFILACYAELLALSAEEQAVYLKKLQKSDDELVSQLKTMLAEPPAKGKFDVLVGHMESAFLSASDILPSQRVGKYEIQDRLGGGGMGVVYRAFDTQLKRSVALKFLRKNITTDNDARARLLVEAQAAASLDHPNICTIYEIGETDAGQLYLAMPCYEGQTLRKVVEAGKLSIETALDYTRQVATGLQQAHAAGIAHRDIKPANLLVTSEGVVKILDFGIAKRTEDQLTMTGSRLGTLAYMSPEQLRNEEVDQQTDIWALGIVLFELLTGERPFQGDYEYALMYALLQEDPTDVFSLRDEVPLEVGDAIRKALSKDKAKRPQTVKDFLDLLKAQSLPEKSDIAVMKTASLRRLSEDGERVHATVVISSLQGYYDLIEELTPDQLATIMADLNTQISMHVSKQGGVVHQFAGEEFILLFGVYNRYEDDGLRAIRTLLKLHGLIAKSSAFTDFGLTLQSAIASGYLIVQAPVDASSSRNVTGQLLMLARRMVAKSEEGKVLLDAETARLVRSHFSVMENGVLKTRHQQVPLFWLEGKRETISPVHGDTEAGLTVFTGRQQELDSIRRCFERVKGGEGQFVTLNGEAGLGKSRLSYEFRKELKESHVRLLIGRCQSYSHTPYLPFLEVLRAALEIQSLNSTEIDPEKIVHSILAIDNKLDGMIPVYLRLLGLKHPGYEVLDGIDGESLRHAINECFSALFIALSHSQPLVLVLDDWHWSDDGSRDILNQWIELLGSHSVLVLLTYRPSFVPDWGHPECHTAIRLRSLGREAVSTVIKGLVGVRKLPEEVISLLMERTEGNPFFLEELVNSMQEGGLLEATDGRLLVREALDHTKVPGSVQAVLRTRFERLPDAARNVLFSASVIGRSFSLALLKAILPAHSSLEEELDAVKKRGLLQKTKVLPEIEYRFKHALIQEVAYESLLVRRKKLLHGEVAKAIESLYPEQMAQDPFKLAHHFGVAEMWEKAVAYGQKASKLAHDIIQYKERIEINKHILSWVEKIEDKDLAKEIKIKTLLIQENICESLFLKDIRQQVFESLFPLIDSDNTAVLCEYYIRKGDFLVEDFQYEEGEKLLKKAFSIAGTIEDAKLLRKAMKSLGWFYWKTGRIEKARSLNLQILSAQKEQGKTINSMGTLINLTTLALSIGDLESARLYAVKCLATLPDEQSYDTATTLYMLGRVEYLEGDYSKAESTLLEAVEVWDNLIDVGTNKSSTTVFPRIPMAFSLLGNIKLKQKNFDEAEYYYNRYLDFRNSGLTRRDEEADAVLVIGNYFLQRGRVSDALEHLEKAESIYEQYGLKEGLLNVSTSLAIAYEQVENYPGAFVNWERVLKLSTEMSNHDSLLKALEGKVRVARLQDRDSEILVLLQQEVLDYAKSNGLKEKEAAQLNRLGILEWHRGQYDKAHEYFSLALEHFELIDDVIHAGLMRNSIGAAEAKQGRNEQAIQTLKQALVHHDQTGQKMLKGHALVTLGDITRDQGDHDKALEYYGESMTLRWEIEDRAGEGWMLERIAQIYILKGEAVEAGKIAQKALEIAEECGNARLMSACQDVLTQTKQKNTD